jgi:hypothetical protein
VITGYLSASKASFFASEAGPAAASFPSRAFWLTASLASATRRFPVPPTNFYFLWQARLSIYFASVDEALLSVESPTLSSALESGSVGTADWDVILAKLSFSCSGSAWFGLPQAVMASTARVAASNVSLII